MSNIKLIIFDFDGVIGDGLETKLPVFLSTINNLIASHFGVEYVIKDQAYLERFIKMSYLQKIDYFETSFWKLTYFYCKILPLFLKFIWNSKPFDGSLETLKSLKKSGYSLSIATRNSKKIVIPFLYRYSLNKYFDYVLDRKSSLDKTDNLIAIQNLYNLSSSQIIFITDTVNDIIDAREAGILTLAVSWGVDSKDVIVNSGQTDIFNNWNDLLQFIQNYDRK